MKTYRVIGRFCSILYSSVSVFCNCEMLISEFDEVVLNWDQKNRNC